VLVLDVSVLVLDVSVLVLDVSVLVLDVLVLDSTLESPETKNPVNELITHEIDDNPSAPTAIIGNELLLLI
jgi:hypothetical protein